MLPTDSRPNRSTDKVDQKQRCQQPAAGHRLYSQADVERLNFILKARQLGFTLEEIREILGVPEQDTAPCEHVVALLEQKLAAIDEQVQTLTALRQELLQLRSMACQEQTHNGVICGMIEGYSRS